MVDNKENSDLDLGLTALLSEASPETPAAEQDNPAATVVANSAQEQAPHSPFAEIEVLAQGKKWREAAELAHSLGEQSQGRDRDLWFGSQAWWIVAQSRGELIPPLILAAPLEQLLIQLNGSTCSGATRELVGSAAFELAGKLSLDSDEWEFAVKSLVAAAELCPAIRAKAVERLNENERKLRNSPLLGIDPQIEVKLANLRAEIEKLVPLSSTPPSAATTGLAGAASARPTKRGPRSVWLGNRREAGIEESKVKLWHIVAALTVIVFAVVFSISNLFEIGIGRGLVSHLQGLLGLSANLATEAPEAAPDGATRSISAPPVERVKGVSSLNALYYELNRTEPADATPQGVQVASQLPGPPSTPEGASQSSPPSEGNIAETAEQPNASAAPTALPPKVEQVAAPPAKLNMNGPVVDQQYRQREQQARELDQSSGSSGVASNGSAPPVPLFPEDREAQRRASSGGDSTQSQAANPDSRPRRQSNPPPVQRYEDLARTDDTYKVVRKSAVLAKPDYRSNVISELYPGDEVEVEAHLGEWVRIVSRRGRIGFVPSASLEPSDAGTRGSK